MQKTPVLASKHQPSYVTLALVDSHCIAHPNWKLTTLQRERPLGLMYAQN
jgi:hypothetical protein